MFRCDGLLVSQSLYEQYVASCYGYELRDDKVEDVDSFRERYNEKLSSRNQLPCDEAMSVKLPTADNSPEAKSIACEGRKYFCKIYLIYKLSEFYIYIYTKYFQLELYYANKFCEWK